MTQSTPTPQYFGTDGIRGPFGSQTINSDFLKRLGISTGVVLTDGEEANRALALIGTDTRQSKDICALSLATGLMEAGVDVVDVGVVPTPAMPTLIKAFGADLGLVVSASHNSFEDNGVKFFTGDGQKLTTEIELAIEAGLLEAKPVSPLAVGRYERNPMAIRLYQDAILEGIEGLDFSALNVVVDCANGAMSHVASQVFQALGLKATLIANQPDGKNINAGCGSTHLAFLKQAVLKAKADLGIAFDGDGDRVLMVNHAGETVDGDEIVYLLAKAKGKDQCNGVVGTQMTNHGLAQAFQAMDIAFARAKVGDKYVLEQLNERDWQLGGESSGHVIQRDKSSTGDGLLAAVSVLQYLVKTQQSLAEALSDLSLSPQKCHNLRTKTEPKQLMASAALETVIAQVSAHLAHCGRLLVRPSGTEPVLRLMLEGHELDLDALMDTLVNAIHSIDDETHQGVTASIPKSIANLTPA